MKTKNQKNQTIKALVSIALLALMANATTAIADNDKEGDRYIVSPDDNYRGLSYSEWAAEWFRWAYSLPTAHHPLSDTADCSAGQTDDVWFIDGPNPGVTFPVDGRDCSIPQGTALFLLLKGSSWDNEACSTDPIPVIKKTNLTESELRALAQDELLNGYGLRKIVIDGVEVKGLPAACDAANPASCQSPFRVKTPVFTYTIPSLDSLLITFDGICYNNPNHGRPYTVTGAVGEGFYVMVKPLPVGKHTIRFGKLDSTGTPTRLYNITVTEHGRDHEHERDHEHGKKGFN
jgi:hypothetical protein